MVCSKADDVRPDATAAAAVKADDDWAGQMWQ